MIEVLTLLVAAIAPVVTVIPLIQNAIEQRRREQRVRVITTAAITVASIWVLDWILRKS